MADSRLNERPADFWDDFFLGMADYVASASKDPSTEVGCVLVDAKRRVIGVGYNGFPRGVDDHPCRYQNRELKYMITQHAEANAVLQATASTAGATAFVTHPPCCNCAGILIQGGVTRVVTRTPEPGMAARFAESFRVASIMFSEAGIDCSEV
jgi:dCMP deaminase